MFQNGNFIDGNVERYLNCSSLFCTMCVCICTKFARMERFFPGTSIVIASGFFSSPFYWPSNKPFEFFKIMKKITPDNESFIRVNPEIFIFIFDLILSCFFWKTSLVRFGDSLFSHHLSVYLFLPRFVSPLQRSHIAHTLQSSRSIWKSHHQRQYTEQSFVCFSCGMIMLKLLKFYATFESAFADDLPLYLLLLIRKQCVSFRFFGIYLTLVCSFFAIYSRIFCLKADRASLDACDGFCRRKLM